MKAQLQKAVGKEAIINSVSGNVVKWRFADKNAHKIYGIKTYRMVKGEGVDTVAKSILAACKRL